MRTSIDARANLHVIEEKYRLWQENPDSVDLGWSAFFEGFELGNLPELNGAIETGVGGTEATEVIDGRHCLRFVGRYRAWVGTSGAAHEVHYIDAKTQMPRRVVTFNLKGKKVITIDTLNVVLRAPPRKLFEIPVGYKRAYHRKTQ